MRRLTTSLGLLLVAGVLATSTLLQAAEPTAAAKPMAHRWAEAAKGLPGRTYYASDGIDFDGTTSAFDAGGGSSESGSRHCAAGTTETYAEHAIPLGRHDVIEVIQVWATDNSAESDLAVQLYRVCFPGFAGAAPRQFMLLDVSAPENAEYLRTYPVNVSLGLRERDCQMMARVRFGNDATCVAGSSLMLHKLRAQIIPEDLIFADDFRDWD